jgi:hypothetical protein
LGAASSGQAWSCAEGHCAEHAVAETPKAEVVAEAPAKPSKVKAKGKAARKK